MQQQNHWTDFAFDFTIIICSPLSIESLYLRHGFGFCSASTHIYIHIANIYICITNVDVMIHLRNHNANISFNWYWRWPIRMDTIIIVIVFDYFDYDTYAAFWTSVRVFHLVLYFCYNRGNLCIKSTIQNQCHFDCNHSI